MAFNTDFQALSASVRPSDYLQGKVFCSSPSEDSAQSRRSLCLEFTSHSFSETASNASLNYSVRQLQGFGMYHIYHDGQPVLSFHWVPGTSIQMEALGALGLEDGRTFFLDSDDSTLSPNACLTCQLTD